MRTHTEKTAGQAVKEAIAPTAPLRYAIRLGGPPHPCESFRGWFILLSLFWGRGLLVGFVNLWLLRFDAGD